MFPGEPSSSSYSDLGFSRRTSHRVRSRDVNIGFMPRAMQMEEVSRQGAQGDAWMPVRRPPRQRPPRVLPPALRATPKKTAAEVRVLLDPKWVKSVAWHDDDECAICLEGSAAGEGLSLLCHHAFHAKCLSEAWAASQPAQACPTCRQAYREDGSKLG